MKNLIFFLSILTFTRLVFCAEKAERTKQEALNKAFVWATENNNVSLQDACILAGADINTTLSNGKKPVQHAYDRVDGAIGARISQVATLLHCKANLSNCAIFATKKTKTLVEEQLDAISGITVRIRTGQEKQELLNKALKDAYAVCKLLQQAGAQFEDEHKEE